MKLHLNTDAGQLLFTGYGDDHVVINGRRYRHPHDALGHLFRFPFGALLRSLGGIPIDRRSRGNRVEELAALFSSRERLVLAIPPEGSRSNLSYWKSGFYWVARTANVPICLAFLDFPRRRAGLGPLFRPTGDLRVDMDFVRAFYAGMKGRFPEKQGPIRLEGEGGPPATGRPAS